MDNILKRLSLFAGSNNSLVIGRRKDEQLLELCSLLSICEDFGMELLHCTVYTCIRDLASDAAASVKLTKKRGRIGWPIHDYRIVSLRFEKPRHYARLGHQTDMIGLYYHMVPCMALQYMLAWTIRGCLFSEESCWEKVHACLPNCGLVSCQDLWHSFMWALDKGLRRNEHCWRQEIDSWLMPIPNIPSSRLWEPRGLLLQL